MESKKMRIKVNVQNIFKTAAEECKNAGVSMAFGCILNSLSKISDRALELNDPVLLEELEVLCLVQKTEAD